jgi:transglutaminase-like putative cysteine protease
MGSLPAGATPKRLTCDKCKAVLRVGTGGSGSGWVGTFLSVLLIGGLAGGAVWYFRFRNPDMPAVPIVQQVQDAVRSVEAQQRIGGETAEKLAKALTPMDPVTRNAAAKIASRSQGPFHVEQVAEIWSTVRQAWRYVNDPTGREYFATASESIQNGYIGDCDDFAIVLTSMVTAIGGQARVVLMDGPKGGHAYAEGCVQGEPTEVSKSLNRWYRTRWRRYISGAAPRTVAYRTNTACPIWLNLDWNSNVPGGPYDAEAWAVAVYEGGRSEPLTPASPVVAASGSSAAPSAGPP